MEHVLITGGAGFIGSHLAEYHLKKGDSVWVFDSLLSVDLQNLSSFLSHSNMRFDKADVRETPLLQEAVEWSDRIYHMAAVVGMQQVLSHPTETLSNNIGCCEKVLQALCKTTKKTKILIASSSEVYCHNLLQEGESLSETATLGIPSGKFLQETYRLSKIVNEVMALSHGYQNNLHCTIARLFNTTGIRQTGRYGMVVPSFIKQALQENPITVYGDGSQTRSFCNVHDTVKELDLLLSHPKSRGEIFNIGKDEECSILELAYKVQKKTKTSSKIQFLNYKEAYGVDFVDIARRRPNMDKFTTLTGFTPGWSLDQTLEEIIEHYKLTPL